jgi:hypothetical protein
MIGHHCQVRHSAGQKRLPELLQKYKSAGIQHPEVIDAAINSNPLNTLEY